MSSFATRQAAGLAGLLAVTALCSSAALAQDAPGPRYTYFGAGYEWGDSRCAIEPPDGGLSGYTVEGSVGLFNFLHVVGTYYDGSADVDVADSENPGETVKVNADGKCYELGVGFNYNFAPGADVIARVNYVNTETDDFAEFSGDGDGYEPQVMVRYRVNEKTEVELGVNYFDIDLDSGDSVTNTEVRLNLGYDVLPWLAVRVGGSVFDDDAAFNVGLRAYFGGNLF